MLNLGFFKKELREIIKTPKLIIIASVFLFFSILSPLTAKYINEILAASLKDVQLVLPTPTYKDAWLQFFKNMTSMCLLVYLIIMTGSIASEKSKGSILLVLTKKVSRFNFLSSKVLAGILLFTASYLVSLLISGYYTYVIFDAVSFNGLFTAIVLMWLLGIFFTVTAIFTSTISKSPTIAALLGFAIYAVLNILTVFSSLNKFNPVGAGSVINNIIAGTSDISDNIISIISLVVLSIIMYISSLFIFRRQEL